MNFIEEQQGTAGTSSIWQVAVSSRVLRNIHFVLFLGSLIACSFASAQQTIHVPSEMATIQAAINVAQDGDTVLVSPGFYSENLDFKGKNITVTSGAKSYSDASTTVLNANADGPAVFFHSGETRSAILNGFTIQNGHPGASNSHGSGVAIDGSSPTISNNVITRNVGCGLVIADGAAPLIQSNDVNGNLPLMATSDTSCQLGNGGGVSGAGVALYLAGNVDLLDNVIENHRPWDYPGSIAVAGILIDGGVVNPTATTIRLEGNIIRNNHGGNAGRSCGVLCVGSAPNLALVNNLFYGNEPANATLPQSQIVVQGSVPEPRPTLIEINNTVYGGGAWLYSYFSTQSVIANNVFYASSPIDYTSALGCGTPNPGIAIHNNDVANAGPVYQYSCGSSDKNLSVDPQFVDPANGDFHTKDGSPLMAAGDVTAPLIPMTDLDKKARTVCNTIDIGAYEHRPHPPIVLTSSANTIAGGNSVTFTAGLTGNCNVPTGAVTFLDNGTAIGTGSLNGSALATYSTSFLTVGIHHITATYPGDFNFDNSTSNTIDLTVTGLPSTTTVSVAPNPAKAFQPITFTAHVTDPYVEVTGSVTFTAGTTTLGTASLVNGVAAITTSQLGAGAYPVTATFNATTQFAASSATTQLQVDGDATTTVLRSLLNPSLFGQPVTFRATVALAGSMAIPQGAVTFRDGATILGTASLDGTGNASFTTSELSIGSHSITALYAGSTNVNSSTSPVLVQVVTPVTTSITLTGAPNPAAIHQQVTLTASIAATLGGAPSSGTLTFADQNGTLGTAPINAGRAVFSTSDLSAGTHTITATYQTSGAFAGSTSAPLTEVIQTFDFAIALSQPTITLASGASATLSVQVQGLGNAAGNVALTASQVPQFGAVTFTPTVLSFAAGGNGSSTLSLTTVVLPQASLPSQSGTLGYASRILAVFAIAPLFFLKRRKIRSLSLVLLGLISLTGLSGCTNIVSTLNHVAPGDYVIPITGVDQGSKITHSVDLTIRITP